METSLHQQLKSHYAANPTQIEVALGDYRIDAVAGDELVEIQHGSLAAIRDKIRALLVNHQVRVVKPIVATKMLVKQDARGGEVVSRRRSPKQGTLLDLFDELVYFTRVYPHRRLVLEAVLVEIEELRYPGHGRRRRRRRDKDHQVEDQRLVQIGKSYEFRTAADLRKLAPVRLPRNFHTGHLAEKMGVERWLAQRIAYCWRHAGTVRQVGKQGNALVYQFARKKRAA